MQNYRLCFSLVLCLSALVSSIPQQDNSHITIQQYENERTDPYGGYRFSYLTSDGSSREEIGEIINPGAEDESISVIGEYAYQDTNGRLVMVSYKADEGGFQILKSSLFNPIDANAHTSDNNSGFTTSSLRNPSAAKDGHKNSAFPNRAGTPTAAASNSVGYPARSNNGFSSGSSDGNGRNYGGNGNQQFGGKGQATGGFSGYPKRDNRPSRNFQHRR